MNICAIEIIAKTNLFFQGHETSKEYIAAQGKNIFIKKRTKS